MLGISERERRETSVLMSLRTEYGLVESKWRFFQGLRYVVFGFLATIQGALFTAYTSTLHEALDHSGMDTQIMVGKFYTAKLVLIIVVILAIVAISVVFLLDARLRKNFNTCAKRGGDIENICGIRDGIFSIFLQKETQLPLTKIYRVIFLSLIASWIYFAYSTYMILRGVGYATT